MSDTTVMTLPDGRELAWLEAGDPAGPPVVVMHGSPGSRLQVSFDEATIAASGVRFIAPDRPGYGHSTYQSRRTLSGWAADVKALADHLALPRFGVVGISGGGPHAAACAVLLPGRVMSAGLVSSVGPLSDPVLRGAMAGVNRGLTAMALRAPFLLRPIFSLQDRFTRRWPEAMLRAGAKMMPPSDANALGRAIVRDAFIRDARQASATTGRAATQDFVLFATDWGFRLENVEVPVHIWHGDADKNVLVTHGRLLAQRIPGSVFHECSGEGHLLMVDHLEEILRTVASAR